MKLSHLLSAMSIAAAITACGGSGGNSSNPTPTPATPTVTPSPTISPTPVVTPTPTPTVGTIRGVIDEMLPSTQIPSYALPSTVIPSEVLPSAALPSEVLVSRVLDSSEETSSSNNERSIRLTLERDQEVNVSGSFTQVEANVNASAEGLLTVNTVTGAISGSVTASNIDEDDLITAVHIHSGFAGLNGSVLIGLEADSSDNNVYRIPNGANISDFANVAGNDIQTFLAGGWYFNLHTQSNPAGQLRGQIVTDDASVVRVELSGDQENPTVDTEAKAVGYFTYYQGNDEVVANVQAIGFEATAAHIHGGFAGANGNVVIGLNDISNVVQNAPAGSFWTTPSNSEFVNRTGALNGGYYFNVHSAANPGGEVRGQILPENVEAVRVTLQTEQEIPEVDTPASDAVKGLGYVTFNRVNEFVQANVSVEGFTGTAAHIHSGFAGTQGDVILVLDEVADSNGTMFSSPNNSAIINLLGLDSGHYYLNVHSAENPAGEVRGQVLTSTSQAVRVELNGAQENPPIDNSIIPNASALGYLTVNTETQDIYANVRTRGFEATAVHIHSGFAGKNGDVIIPLEDVSPNGSSGTVFQSPANSQAANLTNLLNGGYYLNVHTSANPSGEVRGQITPKNVQAVRVKLQTEQEVPEVETPAADDISGLAYFTFNAENSFVNANLNVAGFEGTAAHIHAGRAGKTGNVILVLDEVDGSNGSMFQSRADAAVVNLAGLNSGNYYFNVHSEVNPAGEMRGQILPHGVQSVRVELSGEQEVPPVSDAVIDNASAIGYFTYTDSGYVFANVRTRGFEATAAHIHGGFAGNNGNVIIGLEDASEADSPGTFFQSPANSRVANMQNLMNGGYYLNVHTAQNAPGEVRGQITPKGVQAVRVKLQTEQEVPEVASPASDDVGGIGYFTFNENNLFVNTTITLNGFEGTAAHVHAGRAGTAGNVIIVLNEVDGSNGTVFQSAPDAAIVNLNGLNSGNYYLNVHSLENPAGEVRGQVLPRGVQATRVVLTGTQENPPVTNPVIDDASALGYITFTDAGSIFANVRTRGFIATAAHIHSGFAGTNGAVIIGLEDVSAEGQTGTFFQSPANSSVVNMQNFLSGGYYFNVHTNQNAPGEVRGQIVTANSAVLRAELDASQAIPADTISATGIGYLTVTDKDNGLFISNVTLNGFSEADVTVNTGGDNNQVFVELIENSEIPGTFSSPSASVRSLPGLLNGAYSFEAQGITN